MKNVLLALLPGGCVRNVRVRVAGRPRDPARDRTGDRVQFFVQCNNLTHEANYLGYSGTLSSPFFGRPTTVREMRKIDAGINLNF